MAVQNPEGAHGPFSMTDEERDIGRFQAYLADLRPEALWDVLSHLDALQYPRRHEAVRREIARRGLFFVDPYTRRDHRLRSLFLWTVFLAALSVALHFVARVAIEVPPSLKLPFFTDLAVGSPTAARMVLPVLVPVTVVYSAAALLMTLQGLWLLRKRRIPADLVGLGALVTIVAGLCLAVLFF